ncbi:hypothetical protein JZ751_029830, partial [Albula glossodonta]
LSLSFICPPGRYECQQSGLRWVCVVEVSLQYHYCSWENFEEQQNSMRCTEGGPLLDITVTAGHLDEIHVPHFICLGPDPSLSDRMKVLHVTDSGVSLERVCEVSRFHVKILQPTFSPMGVVVQNLQRLGQRIRESRLRVHCHLLVFHGRKKAHLTLHIYLIPDNPALEKSVEEKEQKSGSVRIYKPSEPERSLQLKKKYKLTTSCTVTIIPQGIIAGEKILRVRSRDSDHEIQHGGYLFITETLFPYLSPPAPLCLSWRSALWKSLGSSVGAGLLFLWSCSLVGAGLLFLWSSSSVGAGLLFLWSSSSVGAGLLFLWSSSSVGAGLLFLWSSSSVGAGLLFLWSSS